jgi:branched-chain amino acid transport system ATP-binding protein
MLRTEGVTKRFGNLVAVDDVDYRLEEGEVASIIGPNGAGKTTFFNLLSGEYAPSEGQVYLRGDDITELPPNERVSGGMGRVFQISNLFPDLSVFEHVRLSVAAREVTGLRHLFADAYEDEEVIEQTHQVMEELEIEHLSDRKAGALSHGDKRLLEVGMALARDPEVILLDEPTSGLPDEELDEMMEFLGGLRGDYTLLFVEHKMAVVLGLSDRISVLHNGRLIADGTVDEIRNDERVREVYLGEEEQYA